MPFHINLLAEALAEEDLRRRDPVKRAVVLGFGLVGLALVWFSSVWLKHVVANQSLNRIDGEIQLRSNDYNEVQNNSRKIGEMQTRMEDLDKLAAARFLQGNMLNALQQTHVPNVQFTHLRVDQNYTTLPASPPKTNSFGVVPGRPAGKVERVTLVMDARDYSPNPGDQVEHFKQEILREAYFASNLQTNGIRLSALSAVQTPPDGKSYIMFSLECRCTDHAP